VTDRSVTHATFTLERTYPADTARVFAAWADPAAKARWFGGPDAEHELDFRVGGREVARGKHDGMMLAFTTTYVDIIDGERIAYTSTLYFGDQLATASLTTVEFIPDAGSDSEATRLVLTEHGAYLDGHERPEWREEGTGQQLAALAEELLRTHA
jgi:uncharacterized protein YndB with AHSA1/START domain